MRAALLVAEFWMVLLLVDFASGWFHWLEDTFWNEETPILGRLVVTPNVKHHENGAAFVGHSWLRSAWVLLLLATPFFAIGAIFEILDWRFFSFIAIGVNANQIHKWSHMSVENVPRPIRVFQSLGLLQDRRHHSRHHRGDKNTHYCVITVVLNPLLDRSRFWRILESISVPPAAASRRTDLAERHNGKTQH